MKKEIRINLKVLAESYGIDPASVTDMFIEEPSDGDFLVIEFDG